MIEQLKRMKLFLLAFVTITAFSSFAQKQFIHTATKANNSCNYDCTVLDIKELHNNPDAVIWVTPLNDKGATPNPHLIGAYYFGNQWRIFNLDGRPIPEGAKFTVEYVEQPDATHFAYSITPADLQKDGSAYIDHAAFNKNPNANFKYFLSWNPDRTRGSATANREETKIEYDVNASKWVIRNINRKPLFAKVVYNIAIQPNTIISTSNSVSIPALTTTPGGPTTDAPITQYYMTVWANGSKVKGESLRTAHLDKVELTSLQFGVTNGDAVQTTRQRKQYEPFIVKKVSGGQATLPYLNALVKNEKLVITIEAYSISTSNGSEELNFTIKLTGAKFISFRHLPEEVVSQKGQSKVYFDVIGIIFTTIEVEKGGYIVVDQL